MGMNKKTFFNLIPTLFLLFAFCIGCKNDPEIIFIPMKWQLKSCSNPAIITTLSQDPVIDAGGIGELTIRCTNADKYIISYLFIDGVYVDGEDPRYLNLNYHSGYEDDSIKVLIEENGILKINVKDNSIKTNYEIQLAGVYNSIGSVYLNLGK